PSEVPVFETLARFTKKHGVTFVINTEAFRQVGIANIKELRPTFDATELRGQTMRRYLNVALEGLGATYLVKNGVIEVVPVGHAAVVTKAALVESDGDGRPRLKEPLVSVVLKEKPLNEVVAKLAEMYDLNVILSSQVGEAKTARVTARLLNVPADKAIEVLAIQCELRMVRKGTVFLIASKDQANELLNEKREQERRQIELEQLRAAPAAPPKPPEPKM
ncbi:MAG TPA: hypothetical protein VGE74_25605, partial [Gemmata sp.]